MSFLLLTFAFSLFYLYDINSITKQYSLLTKCFFAGCLMLSGATILMVAQHLPFLRSGWALLASGLGAIISFALLIYTLFFALPFDDTYQNSTSTSKQTEEQKSDTAGKQTICDTGMYALCRHPGVLWFCTFFLSLSTIFEHASPFWFCLLANAFNLLYVILQDYIIFPKLFLGYDNYKQTTPFLIPTKHSIKRCICTIKG